MRITQGTFSFLPDFTDEQIEAQMRYSVAHGWALDLERLLDALTPATRVVMINSPNNPTGWTIDAGSQRAILEHCRDREHWPAVFLAPPASALLSRPRLHRTL